jgi:acetyl esterase/lipase
VTPDLLDLAPPPSAARLSYGSAPQQFGDLRLPSGPGPHPTIITIHGGFWRSRYRLGYLGHAAAALAGAGFATWNIEYRRVGNPAGGWPHTFLDIAAAADHLQSLAALHHLDLSRVIALGHSAGGHLALWLAGRHRISAGDSLYTPDPLPLRAVISLAGVVDLRRAWELHLSDDAVVELMGGTPEDVPARYVTASPAELLPFGIPQTLIHGTEDDSVPFELSKRYVEQALERGDDARLIPLAGAGHFEAVDPRTAEWQAVLDMARGLVKSPGGFNPG